MVNLVLRLELWLREMVKVRVILRLKDAMLRKEVSKGNGKGRDTKRVQLRS